MSIIIQDIKRDGFLSNYIPFIEVAIEVEKLPFHLQLYFLCSCCERTLPVYTLIEGRAGWLDISNLRTVADELWQIADGKNVNKEEIHTLIKKAETIFIEEYYQEDNYDFWLDYGGTIYQDLAEGVSRFVVAIVKYIDDRSSGALIKAFKTLLAIINEYLDLYFYEHDPQWESRSRIEKDTKFNTNALIQLELKRQINDLSVINNLSCQGMSIDRQMLDTRSIILGSLDDVRLNLGYWDDPS